MAISTAPACNLGILWLVPPTLFGGGIFSRNANGLNGLGGDSTKESHEKDVKRKKTNAAKTSAA